MLNLIKWLFIMRLLNLISAIEYYHLHCVIDFYHCTDPTSDYENEKDYCCIVVPSSNDDARSAKRALLNSKTKKKWTTIGLHRNNWDRCRAFIML